MQGQHLIEWLIKEGRPGHVQGFEAGIVAGRGSSCPGKKHQEAKESKKKIEKGPLRKEI